MRIPSFIKKMKSRFIQFRRNGKFHLVTTKIDLPTMNPIRCEYYAICGKIVIADPDKVAARTEIYKRGIDEYCPICLEIFEKLKTSPGIRGRVAGERLRNSLINKLGIDL